MKVMVIVKASPESEAGIMPSEELLSAMGKYNEELVAAGIMLAGEGLHPSSQGVRVHFSGQDRAVIDGPFAETKELIAGYWLWQVKSMDEAIAWVKRCPNPMESESDIEIRQVFAPEDFGEAYTPELQQREEALRAAIEQYQLDAPRFEQAPEKLIAGASATYTFAERGNIAEQWASFAPHLGNVPGQRGPDAFGVCWNYNPGTGFDYLTGVEVDEAAKLPKGFSQVRLPAARYVVFPHTKHISKIAETIDAIWNKWLPNSGYQTTGAPCFERYTSEYDPQTGIGGTEIWVPLVA